MHDCEHEALYAQLKNLQTRMASKMENLRKFSPANVKGLQSYMGSEQAKDIQAKLISENPITQADFD